MSAPCPSCGAAMAASDAACPSCGEPRPAARPAASSSTQDVFQYVKIVGILVVVVVVVLVVAGMMGGAAAKCAECKGRKVLICSNCREGRNVCKDCKGSGADPGTFSTCLKCNGKGITATCWKCGGRSQKTCPTCNGTGTQPE